MSSRAIGIAGVDSACSHSIDHTDASRPADLLTGINCKRVILGLALVLAFHSRLTVAAECLRGDLPPEVLAPLLKIQSENPGARPQIADAITAMVKKELVVGDTQRAAAESLVNALVPPIVATATSPEAFKAALDAQLTPLCGLLAASPAPSPNAETGLITPAEVKKEDTVDMTLDELLASANRAYHGEGWPAASSNTTAADLSLNKLTDYHRVMLECAKKNKPAACEESADVAKVLCSGMANNSAKCSSKIYTEIQKRAEVITHELEASVALSGDAKQTKQIEAIRRTTEDAFRDVIGEETLRGSFYGLFAGPSFVVEDDGSWKSGVEVMGSFNTEIFDDDHCWHARFCRGFFDISLVTPDAFPTEVENSDELPIAVFDTKGRIRVRAGYQHHWSDWFGFEMGVGITSPIADRQASVRAEPRAHAGFHFQTAYPDRAIGEFFIGYARDQAWERLVDADGDLTTIDDQSVEKRFDRLLFEGTLLFPRVNLAGFSMAARFSADAPWSGDTQSEMRVSILFYYPLNSWLERFKPTVKQAEAAAP